MDAWQLVATLAAPLFALTCLLLLASLIDTCHAIVPVGTARIILEWLAKDYDLDVFVKNVDTSGQVNRLMDTVTAEESRATDASAMEAQVARVAGSQFDPRWKRELETRTVAIQDRLRRRCRDSEPITALKKQGAWQREARLNQLPVIARFVLLPAYKNVVEDSGRKAVHTGALGLLLATFYWLILTLAGLRPQFITDIGNGSAFGAFVGLALAFSSYTWPFFWPQKGDEGSGTAVMCRRAFTVAGVLIAIGAVPLTYYGVLAAVTTWLQSSPQVAAVAYLAVMATGISTNLLRHRPPGTPRADRANLLFAIPGCSVMAAGVIWGGEEVPGWYVGGFVFGSFALAILGIGVAQILDNRELNADRPDGVPHIPHEYVASLLIALAAALPFGLAIWFLAPHLHAGGILRTALLLFLLLVFLCIMLRGMAWAEENKRGRPAAIVALSRAKRMRDTKPITVVSEGSTLDAATNSEGDS